VYKPSATMMITMFMLFAFASGWGMNSAYADDKEKGNAPKTTVADRAPAAPSDSTEEVDAGPALATSGRNGDSPASSPTHSGNRAEESPPASVQTGYAMIGGAKLYYEVLGEGPPLVLIHGGMVDRRMWDDQFEVFARHYRVIRYDVRQHGKTRSRPEAYANHEDLYALLKHLNIDKAFIMGLSMGGGIAIDFTLAHPEMVRALIPVAPGLSGYQATSEGVKEDTAGLMAALREGDFDRAVEFALRAWTDGPRRTPAEVDPVVRERVRVMLAKGMVRAQYQRQAQPLEPPAIGRLSEIRVPTLAIVGDLDMPDILVIVDSLVREIAGAKKVVIPGVAHMVNMEKPAEFNRIVLEFLADR